MREFRKLKVWEKAHGLVLKTYRSTNHYPREELYGLVNQMRRASVSIAANIAEGCVKNTDLEFARFLNISMGSASELEYYFLLSYDLKLLNLDEYEELSGDVKEVKMMLTSFMQRLRVQPEKTDR